MGTEQMGTEPHKKRLIILGLLFDEIIYPQRSMWARSNEAINAQALYV